MYVCVKESHPISLRLRRPGWLSVAQLGPLWFKLPLFLLSVQLLPQALLVSLVVLLPPPLHKPLLLLLLLLLLVAGVPPQRWIFLEDLKMTHLVIICMVMGGGGW